MNFTNLVLKWLFTLLAYFLTCSTISSQTKLVVLGTVQDAGSPHIACKKECCINLFENPDPTRKVVSLGIIDEENKMNWIFDATPDLPTQMKLLKKHSSFAREETPSGIFLTHAHIGHYTGLMYLGREAMSSKSLPIYAMPKMKTFIENNGPWNQLVLLNNIDLIQLKNEETLKLSSNVKVTPFKVPHRDEYSETIGFIIEGLNKIVLFIPDIDKWTLWEKDIVEIIKQVDYAFIDATFYDGDEINRRNISEIPHPFVVESVETFKNLNSSEKAKIYFIHFNHTNALLNIESEQFKKVIEQGYNVAQFNFVLNM